MYGLLHFACPLCAPHGDDGGRLDCFTSFAHSVRLTAMTVERLNYVIYFYLILGYIYILMGRSYGSFNEKERYDGRGYQSKIY